MRLILSFVEGEQSSVTGEICSIGSTDDISELNRLLGGSNISSPSAITKNDLEAKMEMIPERFCFVKCLKASAFINEYITIINSDETQWKYYESGVIKVSTWRSSFVNVRQWFWDKIIGFEN
eukprot:gene25230-33756_t